MEPDLPTRRDPTSRSRPRRRDAVRNEQRVFAAAKERFAVDGANVSMIDIATQAGVGVATLYRSFGDRSQLVEAVYRDIVNGLVAEASHLASGADPWTALTTWLHIYVREYEAKVGMLGELRVIFERQPDLLRQSRQDAVDALSMVLMTAQQAGAARSDVRAADLIHLLNGLVSLDEGDTGRSEILLSLVVDGLRVRHLDAVGT